jgi:predicted RNA-binding protein with RPS1 domain
MNDLDTLVKVTEPEATAVVDAATDAVQDAAPAVEALGAEAESLVNSTDESVETVGQTAAEAETIAAEASAEIETAAVEAAEALEVVTDDTVESAAAIESRRRARCCCRRHDRLRRVRRPGSRQKPSSMADLVDDFQYKPLKAGDTRDGIIVSISPSEILVDVGGKSEGFVHQREMERLGKEYLDSLSVGDSVVVYVVRPEDRDGNIVLSLSRAQQERDWRDAEALLESGDVFESAIIGFNRGGVICRVGKVRGFIPASQLVTKGEAKGDANEETRYASMVGKSLWLKVVELDRKRNRLILSERLAQRERRRGRKDELLGELKKGDVRNGPHQQPGQVRRLRRSGRR